jgi:hypothetical protein
MEMMWKLAQNVLIFSWISVGFSPQVLSISPAERSIEVEGLKYNLQQCTRVGQNVKCDSFVTSTERDVECYLFANKLRAFDFAGNQYFAESAQFGNSSGQVTKVGLIRGIPVKSSVLFNNIQKVNKLAVLEVVVGGGWSSCKTHTFQFRNISIDAP